MIFVDNEKEELTSVFHIAKTKFRNAENLILRCLNLYLFTEDLNHGFFLLRRDVLDEHLILGGGDLMKSEFYLANEVMFIKSSWVLEVLNIVHDSLE